MRGYNRGVMVEKSTVDQIGARFDADVERFSRLETGQSAVMDAVLLLDLVADAAAGATPAARHVLDLGCGAGNFTLRLLQRLPGIAATLCDLSLPMLTRARERVTAAGAASVETIQADLRTLTLPDDSVDVIVAGAVLHHLRTDSEWEDVFAHLFRILRPGGSLWISDLVAHTIPAVQAQQWERYGAYLTALKDATYRETVFAYIEQEDTPRPLSYQLDLLHQVGFDQVDVLHKNGPFAAFGAVKA